MLRADLEAAGVALPAWLAGRDSPWPDRAAFVAAGADPRLVELRALLERTRSEQAGFILHRLERALAPILAAVPPGEQARVHADLEALAGTTGGLFALVDYVNFKGEGLRASERYRGEGWGLRDVLLAMSPGDADSAPRRFAVGAEQVLRRRVANAPAARGEARWLAGWTVRVRRYGEP